MEGLKQEIADLIKKHVAAEGRGVHGQRPLVSGSMPGPPTPGLEGAKITGEELAKIGKIIKEIDDTVVQNQVRSYFGMATKYQALGILTSERSEICQRYPAIVIRIAEAVTEDERAIAESMKKGFQH